ncbi:hypothetical protein EYF80_048333 [Liparis tanakae]|uniref:Uncharacterized protein n=1 Tax=Liparis tanakae TaxID=230148 RepID=A0A4Z2FL53_9TELE|nr:hypothetical protein EYF80_048333 [Liparis tanakae]
MSSMAMSLRSVGPRMASKTICRGDKTDALLAAASPQQRVRPAAAAPQEHAEDAGAGAVHVEVEHQALRGGGASQPQTPPSKSHRPGREPEEQSEAGSQRPVPQADGDVIDGGEATFPEVLTDADEHDLGDGEDHLPIAELHLGPRGPGGVAQAPQLLLGHVVLVVDVEQQSAVCSPVAVQQVVEPQAVPVAAGQQGAVQPAHVAALRRKPDVSQEEAAYERGRASAQPVLKVTVGDGGVNGRLWDHRTAHRLTTDGVAELRRKGDVINGHVSTSGAVESHLKLHLKQAATIMRWATGNGQRATHDCTACFRLTSPALGNVTETCYGSTRDIDVSDSCWRSQTAESKLGNTRVWGLDVEADLSPAGGGIHFWPPDLLVVAQLVFGEDQEDVPPLLVSVVVEGQAAGDGRRGHGRDRFMFTRRVFRLKGGQAHTGQAARELVKLKPEMTSSLPLRDPRASASSSL